MITAEEARKLSNDNRPNFIAGVKSHILLSAENEILYHVNHGSEQCSIPIFSDDAQEALDQVQEELRNVGYEVSYEFKPGTMDKVLLISWKEKKSELAKPRKKTSR